MTHCPRSDTPGKRVRRVTLESLVLAEHQARLGDETWFYCPAPHCPVVYFNAEGDTLDRSALSVRVGVKESGPPRPLCYCFDHSLEEIQAEVAATGTSTIPERIAERCRRGEHDCERRNPQGSCCLGNVRAAGHLATASDPGEAGDEGDCCAIPSPEARRSDGAAGGRLAAAGAVVSAILSSACCWLPLLLLAFGASAAGVSGFFERYRLLFLGAASVLLATGFYFVYLRKPACAPGAACAVPNPRLARVNKVMLWIATGFVLVFASFPNYVGILLGADRAGDAGTETAPYDLEFTVKGMTCEACAATLRSELAGLSGVTAAEVLFSEGRARLWFTSPRSGPTAGAISRTVADAGYEALLPASELP